MNFFKKHGNKNSSIDLGISKNKSTSSINFKTINIDYSSYPLSLILILVSVLLFSIFYVILSKANNETTNSGSVYYKIIEIIIISITVFVLIVLFLNYILDIDITANIKNIFSKDKSDNLIVKNNKARLPSIYKSQKEVFNIPENIYSYSDAKAVCGAYDSELANIRQVQNAFSDGAEWCSYGWSKNQMILFPTQYKTWEKLQKHEKSKNVCGRPGVNGGYVENPSLKFGVNCYGYKPKMNKISKVYMDDLEIIPKTLNEKKITQKADKMKENIKNIVVSPFNGLSWNK